MKNTVSYTAYWIEENLMSENMEMGDNKIIIWFCIFISFHCRNKWRLYQKRKKNRLEEAAGFRGIGSWIPEVEKCILLIRCIKENFKITAFSRLSGIFIFAKGREKKNLHLFYFNKQINTSLGNVYLNLHLEM